MELEISPSRLGRPIGYVADARMSSDFQQKLNESIHGISYSSGFYPTDSNIQDADTARAVLQMRGYTIQPVTQIKEFHTFMIPVGTLYQQSRE